MGHIQRYALEDGSLSDDVSDAHRIAMTDILSYGEACSKLPPAFFDAMAVRESGRATNEQDDETRSDGSIYFTSYGLYQLSDEEFSSTNGIFGSLFDAETSTKVFAQVMEKRLAILNRACGISDGLNWAILAVCHNQGIGAMQAICREYGNDWDAIKSSKRLGGKYRKGEWTDAYDADEDARRQRYGDYVASRVGQGSISTDDNTVAEEDTSKPSEEDAAQFADDVAVDQGSDGVSGILDYAMLFALLYFFGRL